MREEMQQLRTMISSMQQTNADSQSVAINQIVNSHSQLPSLNQPRLLATNHENMNYSFNLTRSRVDSLPSLNLTRQQPLQTYNNHLNSTINWNEPPNNASTPIPANDRTAVRRETLTEFTHARSQLYQQLLSYQRLASYSLS